jgi:hypothetical protein
MLRHPRDDPHAGGHNAREWTPTPGGIAEQAVAVRNARKRPSPDEIATRTRQSIAFWRAWKEARRRKDDAA